MQVYFFGDGHADGSGSLRELLGVKGAGLAEMTRLGIPVPPGFTLPTTLCGEVIRGGGLPAELDTPLDVAIARLERAAGRRFGDRDDPLLLSVRSGAAAPMPGAMATILNVGLNDETVEGLARQSGDERFAFDAYRRFVHMFGNIALGVDHFYFEEELSDALRAARVLDAGELDVAALRRLVSRYRDLVATWGTTPFPDDPRAQLTAAITAVYRSWEGERAVSFRARRQLDGGAGTAVNVQAMVFGTLGEVSGTGVAWTRDRQTGRPGLDGDWLPNAQGEDVLSGDRVPLPVRGERGEDSLASRLPDVDRQLTRIATLLEAHERTVQQLEFTVERERVWVLQAQPARLPMDAAIQAAVDMVHEGLIQPADALQRVDPERLRTMLHPRIDPAAPRHLLTSGLAASPGAASGIIVFSAADAERYAELNIAVILVRTETTPDDIRAMRSARGIITSRGGLTSHAAVVTRQMGRPSVVGCRRMHVDAQRRRLSVGEVELRQGDPITIDGDSGEVFLGELRLVPPRLTDAYDTLMAWADGFRGVQIRSNADSAVDAGFARQLGAAGIGLVRTEHMFFKHNRINVMREVILAQSAEQRRRALEVLRPFQVEDFVELFEVMDGLPVTVRLLDPPLHEFLPQRTEDLEELGARMGISARDVRRIATNLRELNPMLGHRGCRLAISYPEIYDMQATAVFEAMALARARGIDVQAELLIPLVSDPEELRWLRERILALYEPWREQPGMPERPQIGSMIEVARACLMAGELARQSDFLSFGTNDLTQSVYGLSRDDAAAFLPAYLDAGIFEDNPFAVLDVAGVGALIELAVQRARAANPAIRIGLCGEQGGDPRSVAWLQNGVVDYISCSPYRVPVARLAAGQSGARLRS